VIVECVCNFIQRVSELVGPVQVLSGASLPFELHSLHAAQR